MLSVHFPCLTAGLQSLLLLLLNLLQGYLALALVTAKSCPEITLLCIKYHFLQHNAAILIPASDSKMDQLGHLKPQIHAESHSNVNPFLVLYLKVYMCHTEPFRNKLDASHVCSLILGNNRFNMPVCAKTISSQIRRVLHIAKALMSAGTLHDAAVSVALAAGVSLVFILQTGAWMRVSTPAIFLLLTSLLWIGMRIPFKERSWVSVSIKPVGKSHTLMYIMNIQSVILLHQIGFFNE